MSLLIGSSHVELLPVVEEENCNVQRVLTDNNCNNPLLRYTTINLWLNNIHTPFTIERSVCCQQSCVTYMMRNRNKKHKYGSFQLYELSHGIVLSSSKLQTLRIPGLEHLLTALNFSPNKNGLIGL